MSLELPKIETGRLLLRLAVWEDVPELLRYFGENEARFAPFRPTWPANYLTPEFWQLRVRQYEEEFKAGQSCRLFMFGREQPSRIVGNISFTTFLRGPSQSCILGYNLDGAAEGQGLMQEGLRAAIAFAFEQFNIHRVTAQYLPSNARSGKVLERLGFTIEGQARSYLLLDGQWKDHVLTSLINENWVARASEI